jgi:hypothetical protein
MVATPLPEAAKEARDSENSYQEKSAQYGTPLSSEPSRATAIRSPALSSGNSANSTTTNGVRKPVTNTQIKVTNTQANRNTNNAAVSLLTTMSANTGGGDGGGAQVGDAGMNAAMMQNNMQSNMQNMQSVQQLGGNMGGGNPDQGNMQSNMQNMQQGMDAQNTQNIMGGAPGIGAPGMGVPGGGGGGKDLDSTYSAN